MKIEPVKDKNYSFTRRIKVYMDKPAKLSYFQEHNEPIGEALSNMKYDLDTCFRISTEK